MFVFTWEFIRLLPVYLSIIGINILKGGGGISLFSYKVVEFFVDIIYESTFGGYEKVLGISRPEKNFFEFWHPLPYTGGTGFGAIFPYFHLISKYVVYIFFVISLDIELNIVYHDPLIYFRIFFEFFAIFYVKLHKLL